MRRRPSVGSQPGFPYPTALTPVQGSGWPAHIVIHTLPPRHLPTHSPHPPPSPHRHSTPPPPLPLGLSLTHQRRAKTGAVGSIAASISGFKGKITKAEETVKRAEFMLAAGNTEVRPSPRTAPPSGLSLTQPLRCVRPLFLPLPLASLSLPPKCVRSPTLAYGSGPRPGPSLRLSPPLRLRLRALLRQHPHIPTSHAHLTHHVPCRATPLLGRVPALVSRRARAERGERGGGQGGQGADGRREPALAGKGTACRCCVAAV